MISVIIPTYNEENTIRILLLYLKNELYNIHNSEIIVVDGGSTDTTVQVINDLGVEVLHCNKGRGIQLHTGALRARGDILYFVHADSIPPCNFVQLITSAIERGGKVGSFQLQFAPSNYILKFYERFVKFPFLVCRGGDQTLFVESHLYFQIGGFNCELNLMEDIDFIKRVAKHSKFKILEQKVVTSSRKFLANGVIRLQVLFAIMHLLFWLGISNKKIVNFYNNTVTNHG